MPESKLKTTVTGILQGNRCAFAADEAMGQNQRTEHRNTVTEHETTEHGQTHAKIALGRLPVVLTS